MLSHIFLYIPCLEDGGKRKYTPLEEAKHSTQNILVLHQALRNSIEEPCVSMFVERQALYTKRWQGPAFHD